MSLSDKVVIGPFKILNLLDFGLFENLELKKNCLVI